MTTPAPIATRVDYNEVIGRMADRYAAQTAELVMTQVALDGEREAHAATRAQLEAASGDTEAAGAKPPRARRPASGGTAAGTGGGGDAGGA